MMHKKARKQFTEDKQTKDMDYWNPVLWCDETKINLFGSDGVKRVWGQPGEEYKDECVSTVKHSGGSIMVWDSTGSAAGIGKLQFIEGTMNSNMYCDIIGFNFSYPTQAFLPTVCVLSICRQFGPANRQNTLLIRLNCIALHFIWEQLDVAVAVIYGAA